MNLIFIGSAEFAVPSLRSVAEEHRVELVVTQPDRPSGRGMEPGRTSVKNAALDLGLPTFQPEKVNSKASLEKLRSVDPEGFVVAAYGQKISSELLNLVKWPVNIHGSLLPKYRGAAPINWAIIRGESVTGVTTIIMDEGLDSGPILLKDRTEIGVNETAGEVHDRLASMAGSLILETLDGLKKKGLEPEPQTGEPSFAPKLSKEDGLIDWSQPSNNVHDLIRGTYPWPGAYTFLEGEKLQVCRSRDLGKLDGELAERLPLKDFGEEIPPGEIIDSGSLGLVIKCGGKTAVKLTRVQPQSRCEMSGTDFVNGYHIEIGDRFAESR